MRRVPLAPMAIGLIIGIVLDHRYDIPLPAPVIALVLATALIIYRRTRLTCPSFIITFAALATGALCHSIQHTDAVRYDLARYVSAERILVRLEGRVVAEPRIADKIHLPFSRWRYAPEKTSFLLEVTRIELGDGYHETQGRVSVSISEAVLDLQSGDRVRLLGWFYGYSKPRNPGSFDWAAQRKRQGVVAGLSVKRREAIQHLPEDSVEPASWIAQLRDYSRHMLTSDLSSGSSEHAGLLQAMILGHRSAVDRRLNEIFVRAGCIHFLAVSGIHVGIVMLLIRLAIQPIPFLFNKRYWIMGLGIIVYVVLAEPRPSILRAATMGILFCAARLLGRQRGLINAIAAAAVLLLTIDAESLFDVGFQLSFAAVFGIAIISPVLLHHIRTIAHWIRLTITRTSIEEDAAIKAQLNVSPPSWSRRLWRQSGYWLAGGLAVSLSCWLIALPIVVLHFQRVPTWGAINSLIVLPIVTLVMGLGFAKMLLLLVAPWLAWPIGFLLLTSESILIYVVDQLATLPGSVVYVAMPSTITIVLYYMLLMALSWLGYIRKSQAQILLASDAMAMSGKRVTPNNDRTDNTTLQQYGDFIADPNGLEPSSQKIVAGRKSISQVSLLVIALAAVFVASLLPWSKWTTTSPNLRVTFLSVGAGSATVIEMPDGQTWIYDAGTSSNYDLARSTLLPYLSSRGISHIDRIILSHPNLDHYSALPSLLDTIDCGPVVVNRFFQNLASQNGAGRELLETLNSYHHPIETSLAQTFSHLPAAVQLEQVWPTPESPASLSANDTSTVLKLTFAGCSLLLTGDIENNALRKLARLDDIQADVLALPHHGDVEPSTRAFLEAVRAKSFIRSSHQRSKNTKNGLMQLVNQDQMYNTAEVGAVTVVMNEYGIQIISHLPKK